MTGRKRSSQGTEHQPPELTGAGADQYEILGTKTTYRLAQRASSYVVLQLERPVFPRPGKMKTGWFWPLYGDADEVVFTYSAGRGRAHIEQTLNHRFSGALVSDGYAAYARYARNQEGVTHAQC